MSLAAFPPQIAGMNRHGFVWVNDKHQGKNLTLSPVVQYKLKQLWEATTDVEANHEAWSYKHRVIDTAMEVLRTYPSMLSALHLRNTVLQSSHYEFLYDCVRFLETGSRSMSVNHWETVLTYESWPDRTTADDSTRQREARLRDLSQRLKINHETHGPLVRQWCERPGGYVDLAYTLKILYLAAER